MPHFLLFCFILLSFVGKAQLPREDFHHSLAQPLWIVPQVYLHQYENNIERTFYVPIPDSTFYQKKQWHRLTTEIEKESAVKLDTTDQRVEGIKEALQFFGSDSVVYRVFQPSTEQASILYIHRWGSDMPCCVPQTEHDEWYIFQDTTPISLLGVDTLVFATTKTWYSHGDYYILFYQQYYIGNNSHDFHRAIYFRKPDE